MLANVPYFDAAHALKNSKATLVVEVGLIDQTCPSSAIYAALNRQKVKKSFLQPHTEHIISHNPSTNRFTKKQLEKQRMIL